MTVKELKEKCLEGEVLSYAQMPTKEMMADCFTKKMKMPSSTEAVIQGKELVFNELFINEVKNVNGEMRRNNIRNHKKKRREAVSKRSKESYIFKK